MSLEIIKWVHAVKDRYNICKTANNKFGVLAFLTLGISMFVLSSCEKVVLIDLNSSDPRPVVESNITNQPGPYTVKLSRSVNYYDTNTFPAITDATVTISDNTGNTETLDQTSDGIYKTSTTLGIPGRTYFLKIIYNKKTYEASSTMPDIVPIDSVVFTKDTHGGMEGGGNHNQGYRVTTFFKDPTGTGNYYRLQLHSSDTASINQTRYRVLSDKLTDGQEMSLTYNTRLLLNDSVIVSLEAIDKQTFNFYTTLENASGDGPGFLSAPPENPVNNISNKGLGYFSAYSVSENKYIVH